jgi:pseudouridine-5'-phosphate glycosidase
MKYRWPRSRRESLEANIALIKANAILAAQAAVEITKL